VGEDIAFIGVADAVAIRAMTESSVKRPFSRFSTLTSPDRGTDGTRQRPAESMLSLRTISLAIEAPRLRSPETTSTFRRDL